MKGFYIFISIASLISVLITYFLGRFFKSISIVKYLPAIVCALIGIGFLIKARYFSNATGFEDLAYIILALIAGIVFLVSLITAIILGQLQRKSK